MKNELIKLLERYIEENKQLKADYGKYKTSESFYQELLDSLNRGDLENEKMFIVMLIDSIYGKNAYVDEFYTILLQTGRDRDIRLKSFITKINLDYEEIKVKRKDLSTIIFRNKETVSSAYNLINSLRYNKKILDDNYDMKNAKRIISYYEILGVITNKEELLLINELELHNRKVGFRYGYDAYTEALYNEIPNILNMGFQEHDEISLDSDRESAIDNLAKELKNTIDYMDYDEIVNIIEMYKKYNLDNVEYNSLIIKILDEYLKELITYYQLLVEKETYTHRKDRVEIIKNYYNDLEKYLIINNYYNELNKKEPEEFIEEEIGEEVELNQQNRLIYAVSGVGVSKPRIISDMSDVPYEYYNTVYELIDGFKNGKLSKKEIKTLTSSRKIKGHIELKYDQVRIILKHIKDNIYCVLGVFVKKSDNDIDAYTNMVGRKMPDLKTDEDMDNQFELSEKTENQLKELVENTARKGTR